AIAQQLFISRSAVEKHTNAVFDKLRLPRDDSTNRRVLAVLRFLGS
ncbi:DNA-binding response regulator, partial [Streptomyces sp. NPDC004031]